MVGIRFDLANCKKWGEKYYSFTLDKEEAIKITRLKLAQRYAKKTKKRQYMMITPDPYHIILVELRGFIYRAMGHN